MIEITKDSLKGILKHRENDSHKHQYGHLLVVAGCKSMPGAAIMATGAALKSGCGLMTLHSCEKATSAAAVKYPSAMQQISLIPFTIDSRRYMTDIEKIVRESPLITEFQRKVYLETLRIPIGQTITYGELAQRIGCRSARAVGQALHRNPFAPEVPCHRVVAAGGKIGGYAFGIEKKRELLQDEQNLTLKLYSE